VREFTDKELKKVQRQVEKVLEDRKKHKWAMDHHRGQIYECEEVLLSIAAEILEVDKRDLTIGSWQCPDPDIHVPSFLNDEEKKQMDEEYDRAKRMNVLKVCAYNDVKDPMHDHCLFCGQPNERK
jgi:hypothetical protein